jgi:selenocysteine-specific elongation factor
MKSIIVGTAGHIDHGKTALVKALTGIDADRLDEEKRRGITIDIGFAHLDLETQTGETIRVGFIDVPGHERFVRNMLAGIGGIDLVLLIVAADESIKPQTREHFDICRLLSVQRGISVITKADLVDKETLDLVRLEIEDFVRGSFLDASQSPIIAVSSTTGVGLTELKDQITKLSLQISHRRSDGLARLPIDRAFTMKGFGTVVTGTLISGRICKEDELELFPGRNKVRVRGLHVHGQGQDEAIAGQRTAVNLPGIDVDGLKRGMTLASPAMFEPTSRVDVSLRLLKSAKPLKQRARIHFHCYTMESVAEICLFGKKQLDAGDYGFAQLRLRSSALLLPGDRFILRQLSPATTIGGGVVLESFPVAKIKNVPLHLEFLNILKTGSPREVLRARINIRGTCGIALRKLVVQTGWPARQIISIASEIPQIQIVNDILIANSSAGRIRDAIISSLEDFHKRNALVAGIGKEELRERLPVHATEVYEWILQELSAAKKIELIGELVRLTGRGVLLGDEEEESKRTIESAFLSAGLKAPALNDVLAGLKIDRARAQKIVTLLLRDKRLVKISNDLVFHSHALEDLRKSIAQEKTKSPQMNVARFKDLAGVSRKYAIPLLEYLDREHVTRRVGEERVIL